MVSLDRILGLGSPHGDDQVGWRLIELLQNDRSLAAHAICLRHSVELLQHLDGCDRLVVVDACRNHRPPGTLSRLVWPDARIHRQHTRSTHGLDAASTLQLASHLGRLPRTVVLFGVAIAACLPVAPLSDPVERALPLLHQKVLDELVEPAIKKR